MGLTLRFSWIMVLFSLMLPIFSGAQAQSNEENPLQVRAQLVPYELSPGQGAELRLQLHLPEGYRAYADMFKLALPAGSEFHLGKFHIEPLKEFFDETSHKKKMGVINTATMTAPIEAPLIL